MAKRQKRQIRYLWDGYVGNYPQDITRAKLISGSWFKSINKITELKITAMMGFGFFVNDTPSPLRVLQNGDPVPLEDQTITVGSGQEKVTIKGYNTICSFEYPTDMLKITPIYNVKCEASSIDKLIHWNQQQANNPNVAEYEWLVIDYVEEGND